jgi:hypothetical protein
MRTAGSILGIVLAAALGACAHHNAQNAGAQNPSQGGTTAQGTAATCPLAQLHGINATVTDIHEGVAVTFTGPKDQLDQLRDNVKAMGDANDKQGDAFAACPCGVERGGAAEAQGAKPYQTGQTSMQGVTRMVPADSKVDEIPTGAVLKLTAKNKGDVGKLRQDVRRDVQALRAGCLMQGGQGGYENPNQP